jgi:hypothetical protein
MEDENYQSFLDEKDMKSLLEKEKYIYNLNSKTKITYKL